MIVASCLRKDEMGLSLMDPSTHQSKRIYICMSMSISNSDMPPFIGKGAASHLVS